MGYSNFLKTFKGVNKTNGACRENDITYNLPSPLTYFILFFYDESMLQDAVYYIGPVSVLFDASDPELQFYQGGTCVCM